MSQKIDGVQVGKMKTNFYMIPNIVGRGGHGLHMAVLNAIVSHGDCWASLATLAKEAGCSRDFVKKSLKYWQKVGPAFGISLRNVSGKEKGQTNTITVDIDFTLQDGGGFQDATGGFQEARGWLLGSQGGGFQEVTKKTPIKNTTLRRDTHNHAPDGAGGGDDVNQVFKVFYENGSPGIKYGNKTLRKDAQWLIDQFGLEETTRLAEVACNIQGKQYAPTIANPTQLREKLSSLQAFVARSISKDANRAPSFIETM